MAEDKNKTSRRTFLKSGAGLVGTVAVASDYFSPHSMDPVHPPRPNFIFVTTDGHRPDALSLNGHPIVKTPNFDRIGREGIQFGNSFVVNALCLPSRATVLTGLYSHSTGCVDNKNREIPKDVPFLTDLLRDAGYEVALFGKAHVKALGERNWDYYLGYPSAATDYFWPVFHEGRNGQVGQPRTYEGYVEDLVTDRAIEWLKQKREKPFCMMLWFQSPHAPFFRARRHLDLYNGIAIPKPSTFDEDLKGYPGKPRAFAEADDSIGTYTRQSLTRNNCARSLEEVTKDYYAGIVSADENMGRVFQTLKEIGQLDDTAIMFSSDHGFFLGEWRKYDKRFMHEPSIRTPMLVRYPRMIRAGTDNSRMVLNLDIAPTFLELAGVLSQDDSSRDGQQPDGTKPGYRAHVPRTCRSSCAEADAGAEYGSLLSRQRTTELAKRLAVRIL